MKEREIHLNDIGTLFEVTVKDDEGPVPITSATLLEFVFYKPDKTRITRPAALDPEDRTGVITYTTVEGDLDIAGLWQYQVFVQMAGGEWHSEIKKFIVHKNL